MNFKNLKNFAPARIKALFGFHPIVLGDILRTYAKTFAIAENKGLTAKGKTCKSLNSAILRKS